MAYKYIEDERRYDREWKRRYRTANAKKHRDYMREYTKRPDVHEKIIARDRIRHRTPESIACRRNRRLLLYYGISSEQYDRMLVAQNGVCAICFKPPSGIGATNKYLHVDHDHRCCPGKRSCGKCLRSLLCKNCNNAIGLIFDSAELAGRIAKYLISIL